MGSGAFLGSGVRAVVSEQTARGEAMAAPGLQREVGSVSLGAAPLPHSATMLIYPEGGEGSE